MVGCVISHYEILDELGRGGMGIVYRAHDQVLERTVAIKVLPHASLVKERDRSRFFREARAAAALQHTNIANIYEIDEAIPSKLISRSSEHPGIGNLVELDVDADPRLFIAMEFIEGLSLAECIDAGDMPLKTVATLARQIADGLSAAHERGVVHRDVKPSNVMVTGKMEAKILDFGIARQLGKTRSTDESKTSGTTAYMSPEQATGEEVDQRSDIWSMGVLLHEMLTGKRPFRGVYEQAIVYMIVNADPPPVTSLRPGIPEIFDFILSKCLAKNPDDRYQSAAELAVDLRSAEAAVRQHQRLQFSAPAKPVSSSWSGRVDLMLTALVFLLLGFLGAYLTFPATETVVEPYYPYELPAIKSFSNTDLSRRLVSISPQGTHVAHIDGGRVMVRSLSDPNDNTVLEKSMGARGPFISPDGQVVAYERGRDGMLVVSNIQGGLETEITRVGDLHGGSWASPTDIVYAAGERGVFRVSLLDNNPELLLPPDSTDTYIYTAPQLFLDKNKLLYTRVAKAEAHLDRGEVFVRDLNDPVKDVSVWPGVRNGFVLPSGHLVAYSDGKLWAKMFDLDESGKAWGSRAVVAVPSIMFSDGYKSQNQSYSVPTGDVHFSVSESGTAAYLTGDINPERKGHLVLVDERKTPRRLTNRSGKYFTPAASPDGKWIVVSAQLDSDPGFRLYRIDVAKGSMEPFTTSMTIMPVISPDGQWVYYSRQLDGQYDLFRKRLSGDSREEPVIERSGDQFITDFNERGDQFLVFSNVNRGQRDIEICSTTTRECDYLFNSDYDERNAVFSPTSDLIAYTSSETGISEVYLTSLSDPSQSIKVSEEGGFSPVWSADGSRLYYYRVGSVFVAQVDPSTGLSGAPSELFGSEWFPNYYLFSDVGRMTMNAAKSGFLLFEEDVSRKEVAANIVVGVHWLNDVARKLEAE